MSISKEDIVNVVNKYIDNMESAEQIADEIMLLLDPVNEEQVEETHGLDFDELW